MINGCPSVHDILRRRLLERAGVVEWPKLVATSVEWLYATQWCPAFEQFMRNRLAMGALRHGSLHAAARRLVHYDNIGSSIRRLEAYLRTGNQEHLVDVANLCMVEFVVPSCHPSPHWQSADDDEHTRRG